MRRGFAWHVPLRTHLIVLVAGTLLPALALAAFLVRRVVDDNRITVEQRLLEAARSEAAAVDAELSGTIRALQALSESDRLNNSDFETFYQEAARVQRTQPSWNGVILATPEGLPIIDTRRASGDELHDVVDLSSVQRVATSRAPVIGNLQRHGGADERLQFTVDVPVFRDGTLAYVLSTAIAPGNLTETVNRSVPLPDEWVRGIVDRNGVIVVRTRDPERYVGQKGTAGYLKQVEISDEQVYRDVALDGQPVYGAFSRAPMSKWIAGVAVPVSQVDGPFRSSMGAIGGIGLLLLGLGAGATVLISRRISRDISNAAAAADAIVEGGRPAIAPSAVTEVRRLSDALIKSAELLEARQSERDAHVAQADAARAEAEAADRAKDEFLAMLGHELRNPLAPILTALQLMKLRQETGSERERDVIERQVRHLARLVDDLLDVSRLRQGKIELKRTRFELLSAVTGASEIAWPLIEQRRHHLSIEVPASGLPLEGDEVRLAQVIANLMTNAAKYTDPGGHITVRARAEGSNVLMECEDDGIGIPPDLKWKVFDLFMQGDRSRDRQQGGLGLGLAVARTLTELHGGSIDVRSEGTGKGSVFTVRFPLAPSGPIALRSGGGTGDAPSWMRRVLLVDDNADGLAMLAESLRVTGLEVVAAPDGQTALKLIERFVPDVAILDVGLPGMDGFELAQKLGGRPAERRIVLIALTGYSQDRDIVAARSAGFDAHLVKPVSLETLLETLNQFRPASL